MNFRRLGFLLILLLSAKCVAAEPQILAGVNRIVFLGDSNTYAGQHVEYVEAIVAARMPGRSIEIINLGLPSETASGLSEPEHPYPRPCVHERLDRTLARLKPQLVIVCYGMNDGIYYPLSPDRLAKFAEGMSKLVEKVTVAGAKIILLTPPPFDALPVRAKVLPPGRESYSYARPYQAYDQTLATYSLWLKGQARLGWTVLDIREPMIASGSARRVGTPDYTLAGDGIHYNATGHWIVAKEILVALGVGPQEEIDGIGFHSAQRGKDSIAFPDVFGADNPGESAQLVKLIHDRQTLMKDAYLTEIGHKRPDMPKGLALADATKKAEAIDKEIRQLVSTKVKK